MAKNKSPAFQTYPADYWSDSRVMRMTWEERGVYQALQFIYWRDLTLPDDPEVLAETLGIEPEKFSSLWKKIRPCFQIYKKGVLFHPELRQQKDAQLLRAKTLSERGKSAISKRWGINKLDTSGIVLVLPNDTSASASASATTPEKKTSGSRVVTSGEESYSGNVASGDSKQSPSATVISTTKLRIKKSPPPESGLEKKKLELQGNGHPDFAQILIDGSLFEPTAEFVAEAKRLYLGVDVEGELRKMRGWTMANPKHRKTARGAMRFAVSWLAKAQDQSRPGGRGADRQTQHERNRELLEKMRREGKI